MNKSLSYILAVGLVLGTIGCKKVKTETSDVLYESATVLETIFTPSRHDVDVGMTAVNLGGDDSPIGMDYSGKIGINIGSGLNIHSSTVPEKYGVLFRCSHGTFTSQGSDVRHKNLKERMESLKGKEVTVMYKEIYKATYDDRDKDGQKELVDRVLVSFDFLDAMPKTSELERR